MKYQCVAWDKSGRRIDEIIESDHPDQARESLSKRGLYVTQVEPAGIIRPELAQSGRAASARRAFRIRPGKSRLLATYTRQLSVLISTGTPVVDALEAVSSQVNNTEFHLVISDVRTRVEEGSTLSDAMSRHPDWFDSVAISLVSAGEAGGQLDLMLQRLSVLTQQQAALRGQLAGAMVYPSMLSVVAITVFILMTAFVVPRFSGLFETLDVPLPGTTAALLGFSGFLRGYWWALAPAALSAATGCMLWLKSEYGRACIDTAMIRLPKVSAITRSLQVARMSRLLGLLLTSRVQLVDALGLTRMAMGNRHYRSLVESMQQAVINGEPLSSVMLRSELIPKGVSQAVRNGEKAGKVGEVLTSMADSMDDDNQVVIKSMSTLLEPVILIALGLMVGFVTISMFMPLFDVTAAAGGAKP